MDRKTSAICLTGGKDSMFAYYLTKHRARAKEIYQFSSLPEENILYAVSFGPCVRHHVNPFKAHNLHVIKAISKSVGLQYIYCEIPDRQYEKGYEDSILSIKKAYGIESLVTGDIDLVNGYPNYISERSKQVGMKVHLPLWNIDRDHFIRILLEEGFYVYFTLVKSPWFDVSWVGQRLTYAKLDEMKTIPNLDLCGENGEYHTMVLDSPDFVCALGLKGSVKEEKKNCGQMWWYLDITDVIEEIPKGNSFIEI